MLFQLLWLGFVIVLTVFLRAPAPNLDAHGFAVVKNAAITLLIYIYVLLTALGMGRRMLVWLERELSRLEFNALALLIGFAILSDGILILGLLHILYPVAILLLLAVAGLFASFQWRAIVEETYQKIMSFRQFQFSSLGMFEYILWGVIGFLGLILPVVALAPVRDYDALMYHLEIPRQYLVHGMVYFDPGTWRSAYPMLTEMLFTIGIIFHAEPLTQLFSLTFFVLFLVGVYTFGRRFFDSKIALLAVGILLGNPVFPTYATTPNVDFSWASYELWSVCVFSLWLFLGRTKNNTYWLILAGVLSGFTASIKYLSFPTIFIIGLLIFLKTFQLEKADLKKIIQNLLIFGCAALVVIAPWYLKNWIWTGNPFYPLVFGGPAWTSLRQELYFTDYMGSFGTGRGWLDYLLLPINLYLAHSLYTTISLEIVHPMLWLGFGFIFVDHWKKHDYLMIYIAISLILWAVSSQVIRFLLPVSGFLAILSALVLSRFSRAIRQVVTIVVVGGFVLVTALYQIWALADSSLFGYFSGKLSVSEFLQNEVYDYKTDQFIQANLQPSDRVLFLWAGQGYYCDARCWPDDDENLAIQLSINTPAPEALAHQLRLQGATHILLGRPNAYWFITLHDPRQRHLMALKYFERVFIPACGKSVYKDGPLELFQITCK